MRGRHRDALAGEPQRRLDEPRPRQASVRAPERVESRRDAGHRARRGADRVVDELLAERHLAATPSARPRPTAPRRSSRDCASRRWPRRSRSRGHRRAVRSSPSPRRTRRGTPRPPRRRRCRRRRGSRRLPRRSPDGRLRRRRMVTRRARRAGCRTDRSPRAGSRTARARAVRSVISNVRSPIGRAANSPSANVDREAADRNLDVDPVVAVRVRAG